jgi:hypothetical protein
VKVAIFEQFKILLRYRLDRCCAAGETFDDLLRKADAALYAAKRDGKNSYREANFLGAGAVGSGNPSRAR